MKFRENLFRVSRYVYKDTHTHTHIHTCAQRYGEAKERVIATFDSHGVNKWRLARVLEQTPDCFSYTALEVASY